MNCVPFCAGQPHNGRVSDARPRILLVDDDRELVALMPDFLSSQGYAVTGAYSGPAGLETAMSGEFDILLLDVMMPGFDGFELLRRLRAWSDLPVLMLTARTEAQSRILRPDSGADNYLPKPFEPMELARIRAVPRRSRHSVDLDISGVCHDEIRTQSANPGLLVEIRLPL